MKHKILILTIMVLPWMSTINGQKTLTLKDCYEQAKLVSALAGEMTAYSEISKLRDNNLTKGWLPTLDANANLVYNSDVVDMSGAFANIPVPGFADAIKPLPHEQYRITVDINQVFYDGGAIKNARALEEADLLINEKQTETDLYKLRGQINAFYFNILLLNKQKELLNNYLEVIIKRIASMNSALSNGVILKSDIDVLTSEKIKLEQQLAENDIRKIAFIKILSGLIGEEIAHNTVLILPEQPDELTTDLNRPELDLFKLRDKQLDAGMAMLDSKRMPKAFGFATLGYGNPPGSNFFKDEFAPFYVVGAGVKWNIFDWNKTKNEKKIITTQRSIIENRKNDLTENLTRQLDSKAAEIESLSSLLSNDDELIAIRKRISSSAESQYENGTITATDYLNELNSEKQAVLNNEIHKTNLSLAKVEYINISGKELK
jgi:outer membrane protein TolC